MAVKNSKQENKKGDLAYYITLVKIAGHTTWRASLHSYKEGFKKEWNNELNGKRPKITDEKVLRIDRITGIVSPEI